MAQNGDTVWLVSLTNESGEIVGYHIEASEGASHKLCENMLEEYEEITSCSITPIIIGYFSEEFDVTIH